MEIGTGFTVVYFIGFIIMFAFMYHVISEKGTNKKLDNCDYGIIIVASIFWIVVLLIYLVRLLIISIVRLFVFISKYIIRILQKPFDRILDSFEPNKKGKGRIDW